jgi:hypothetical protein
MRRVRVDSETMRPPLTDTIRSSFADDAIAILDEINQNVEDLRLARDNGAAHAQFTTFAVEREILE